MAGYGIQDFDRLKRPDSINGLTLAYSAEDAHQNSTPVLDGAQAALFRANILPHINAAYGYARYLVHDAQTAEDIVQDAFVRAMRAFAGFHGIAAKAWLLAIVRNCYFDWLKANRNSALLRTDTPVQASDPVEWETPESILHQSQQIQSVRAIVDSLDEPFRETLILRELEQLSYKEIAELTRAPLGTVMSRLARAREMLAKLLLPVSNGPEEAEQ